MQLPFLACTGISVAQTVCPISWKRRKQQRCAMSVDDFSVVVRAHPRSSCATTRALQQRPGAGAH